MSKAPLAKRAIRKALLISGGLAATATGVGAATAAKTESDRPLAPPTAVPPGY